MFHFYEQLSRHYQITLLAPTYSYAEYEEVQHNDRFRAVRIPKESIVDVIHSQLDAAAIGPECSGLALALASARPSAFATKLASLAREADAVVHESPFTVPYDTSLLSARTPRIYNSYNVEADLARQMLTGYFAPQATRFVERLERLIASRAEHVFATSDDDRRTLVERYGLDEARTSLAENGFHPSGDETLPSDTATDPADIDFFAVFMGSQHPPNIEAARFILNSLAPRLPQIRFIVFGAVCSALGAQPKKDNVELLGRVDEQRKQELLARCGIALNPMSSGSGTNLKMFDYLAAGACVVTTAVGARGIDIVDRMEALIVSREQMCDVIREVAQDPGLRARIGEAARRKAHSKYAWQQIVAGTIGHFERVLSRPSASRRLHALRVLVLNDYAIGDGSGGGQRRLQELLGGLSRHCHVHMLCLGDVETVSQRQLHVRMHETIVPKSAEHKAHERAAGQLSHISVADIVAGLECRANETLRTQLALHAENADVVVLEHPYLSPLLTDLPADKPIVYSAQNVERDLKASLLDGRPDADSMLEHVVSMENYACVRARLIVCVCEEDARRFEMMFNGKATVVISNGVEARPYLVADADRRTTQSRQRAVFIGSAHVPNIEAVEFITGSLATACPQFDFDIVGSCGDVLATSSLPANVSVHGKVSDTDKAFIMRNASIGINPMSSGGGSSLKMPEMMSFGLPVVSTEVGARGYGFVPETHYVSTTIDHFAVHLNRLSNEPSRATAIGATAAAYVERQFTWAQLAERYADALQAICASLPRRVRVLAVTFRSSDPIRGGAELYLDRVLTELHHRTGFEVDLATFAIDAIDNRFHFSARYSPSAVRPPKPVFAKRAHWFDVDPIDDTEALSMSRRLFALWSEESLVRARSLQSALPTPALLGGWNYPESSAEGIARWTTRRAEVQISPMSGSIAIAGHAPKKTMLGIECDGQTIAQVAVSGAFETTAALPPEGRRVSIVVTDAFDAPADPRELGVLVRSIVTTTGENREAVHLDRDAETITRESDPARLIESLIETVRSRDAKLTDAFINLRGPRSLALDRWLLRNVGRYDVVIAHGAPFRPMVAAERAAALAGIPTIVLPHFHSDDPYYHWLEFYESFKNAACVICAPERSKVEFFDTIGAPGVVLPGGGIDPGEFEDCVLKECRAEWTRLFGAATPFVLVLGRKAAAKNMQSVIDAVRIARAEVPGLECVFIGPADDGSFTPETFVRDFGLQPRRVVLGALATCLCVANMSRSESFGIVLLEAWMAGAPVVVSRDTPAFAELVAHEVDGMLVGNAVEAASAFVSIALHPAERADMVARGRQKAADYSWTRIAAGIATQIDDVLQARPPDVTNRGGSNPEARRV